MKHGVDVLGGARLAESDHLRLRTIDQECPTRPSCPSPLSPLRCVRESCWDIGSIWDDHGDHGDHENHGSLRSSDPIIFFHFAELKGNSNGGVSKFA
jgi:hypothetical protein